VNSLVQTELVITAPRAMAAPLAYAARCRQTLGVLTELLATADDRLIMAAPFFQPGAGLATGLLRAALIGALKRGVRVDLVSTGEGLMSVDAGELRRRTSGRLRLYRPAKNVMDQRALGSHAKFCVADGSVAYVGSANLTAPALRDQLELGVLLRGPLARQVEEFWKLCLDLGIFVEVSQCP
jgi:phosphatidylserine/phosphatidylglycerophosphate/cardiolipin synthase-like enzyme